MLHLLALVSLLPLAFYLYNRLQYYRRKEFAGYPQLPPSLLWGHLKAVNDIVLDGEPRRHIDQVLLEIKEHLNHPPLFILDLRPIQSPLCVICNHEVAEQVSRSSKKFPYSMDKSFTLGDLEALIGRQSIIAVQGDEWKTLRKRFNPGFAPQHLLTLLPCTLERSQRFIDIIDGFAKSGEEFRLAEPCANLTFDIIGAVTMDEDFFAQSTEDKQSEIYKSFLELAATYPKGGGIDLDWLNVFSRLKRRSLTRKLDSLLQDHIKKKFAELESSSVNKSRSILSLSLQGVDKLDQRYLDQTSDQLKTFLFAGYDTTSIVLQWAFYELSRTPHALHAIREEVNATFGRDASPSATRNMLLSRGDELIGKMTYTSAVIKEVLRLHPPSGSARYTPKGTGYNVQTPEGDTICLDGMIVYNCETIIQRDEMIFGETKDAFVPERWIGNSDTSIETNTNKQVDTRIPPSAWRPFERGPRNCIGQELANLEFRVVLACTIRRYNFTKVGLGELARSTHGELIMGSHGQYTTKSELFNTMQVTAKPEDGTRMRVAFTR